jgi:hypothetical protein
LLLTPADGVGVAAVIVNDLVALSPKAADDFLRHAAGTCMVLDWARAERQRKRDRR